MLTFLFWNMGGKLSQKTPPTVVAARNQRLLGVLRNLVALHKLDFLILAEWPVQGNDILTTINTGAVDPFQPPDPRSLCDYVLIFSRTQGVTIENISEGKRYTGRLVRIQGIKPFLLFAAHFGSKLRKSDDSQTLAAPALSQVIRDAERSKRIDRTILVGDLNMNPFDTAMVGGEAFNAVMTAELAASETRTVDGVEYPFFYNPMWSHFGDSTHEDFPPGHTDHQPAGTCCYQAAESKWYYWNMFDQVLIRPKLLAVFKAKELKILTGDGTTSFLNQRGRPDRDQMSDHLPLLFRLHM